MSRAPLPASLWALLAGNFVIGTGVMLVAGTLNEISGSFGVSVSAAGQLMTAGALVVCFGAPLLAALVAGWDRRMLLALTMVWYGVCHVAAALMPSYFELLVVRMLTMLAPAIFTAQAAASAGMLVPPDQRGRGVTFVFLGWSMASVLGLPLGAWLGGHYGWRAAFLVIAVAAICSAAWIWSTMPTGVRPAALTRAAWARVFKSPALMGVVTVTALQSTGQFVVFAYFAPLLKQQLGADATQQSFMWAWFGACGLVGNILVSRYIDRIGAGRAALLTTALMATSLLLWPLGVNFVVFALVVMPWGLGCFAANSAQQARLVGLAPAMAAGSVALNSSGMFIGQAIGAATGGWLLAHDAASWMHWAGLGAMLVAMTLSIAVDRLPRPA
ncbi:MFS transporter [Variovorax humicola]|uniref:MFS transporter n=1 Tax=Variovorax humicola TaxID=1769758 RepID=A0ABU8VYK3_9BURK